MHLRETAEHLGKLLDCPVGGNGDTQHLAQHRDADLASDAGKKSDENRFRQEISKEAELEQARQQQAACRQQRHQPGQFHVLLACEGRHVQ